MGADCVRGQSLLGPAQPVKKKKNHNDYTIYKNVSRLIGTYSAKTRTRYIVTQLIPAPLWRLAW